MMFGTPGIFGGDLALDAPGGSLSHGHGSFSRVDGAHDV